MKTIAAVLSFTACLFAVPTLAQESNPMLSNALKFLDTPYAANTLEVTDDEELIINCDEVDCTTLVEYVLAMSLCPEQGDDMMETDFADNVQKIRYRDGKIDGYTSRLHYITDWINDNVSKGTIQDITAQNSKAKDIVNVSYMSTHPDKYIHLKNSPENVAKMAKIEQSLSGKEYFWLPKDMVPIEGAQWIKNGDIIAITTNVPGLDISHMGIAIYVKGNLHLLHASSKQGKVVVEKYVLNRQLAQDKSQTGIRVLRMNK